VHLTRDELSYEGSFRLRVGRVFLYRTIKNVPNLARMTGRALGWFLVFDVIGVLLTLLAELTAGLSIVLEVSDFLGYAVWFVVGVFCGICIYPDSTGKDDHDSDEGRRNGLHAIWVTGAVAAVLAALSSLVWSSGDGVEAVAPDHRGVTITYLVTTVLTVAFARFVVFREQAGVHVESRPATPRDETRRYQRALARKSAASRPKQTMDAPVAFKAALIWRTLGFGIGVPILLFLDASFFVFAPFDYFDQWMDPILTASLVGGLAWGIASAVWQSPRVWLALAHAPPLLGTLFYLFALLIGGLLFAFGVPEGVLKTLAYVAFWIGFLLGCGAIAAYAMAAFGGSNPDPEVLP
jgi:hypothetical protein